jgi:hypothetical protein
MSRKPLMKSNIDIDPRLSSRVSPAKEIIEQIREEKYEQGSLTVNFSAAVDGPGCFLEVCQAIQPNTSIKRLTFNFCQRRGQEDPGSFIALGMTYILKSNDITSITLNDFDTRYPMYQMIDALKENKSVTSFHLPRLSNTSANTQVAAFMQQRSSNPLNFFKKPDERKLTEVQRSDTNTQNSKKSDAEIESEAENILRALLNN